jgi:hypothetical protein
MNSRTGFALLAAGMGLFLPCLALADGCILKKGGGYVPEWSQVAFIEWNNGQERLFVATKADVTAEPTVWIIPVPANPDQVKAEPVERFPRVMGENQLPKLRKRLEETQVWVLLRNTGFWPVLALFGTRTATTFSTVGGSLPGGPPPSDVQVHSHVEKHGMVVEVLTARTPEGLDRYLNGKQLGVKAEQLTSLKEYIGQECSLICSWRSEANATARAVRIDFPSPHIYYPLLPSRVYQHEVPTSVFVRGWVRPTAAMGKQYVHCTPGLWRVQEQGSAEEMSALGFGRDDKGESAVEPLTRVAVSSKPSQWQTDLTLEPAATAAPALAGFLASRGEWLSFWLNVALGLLLGLCFSVLLLPKEKRRWYDWIWLPLVGASLYFSVFGMALAFWLWSQLRLPDQIQPWTRFKSRILILCLVGLVIMILGIALSIGHWPSSSPYSNPSDWRKVDDPAMPSTWEYIGRAPLLPSLLIVVGTCLFWITLVIFACLRAYQTLGGRAGWLWIFVALHGALVYFFCEIALVWLSWYR